MHLSLRLAISYFWPAVNELAGNSLTINILEVFERIDTLEVGRYISHHLIRQAMGLRIILCSVPCQIQLVNDIVVFISIESQNVATSLDASVREQSWQRLQQNTAILKKCIVPVISNFTVQDSRHFVENRYTVVHCQRRVQIADTVSNRGLLKHVMNLPKFGWRIQLASER